MVGMAGSVLAVRGGEGAEDGLGAQVTATFPPDRRRGALGRVVTMHA